MTEHDPRFADAAAAFLLGALEPQEAADFVAHLDDCPACRAELDELRVAADALPSGVPQYRAPAELEDRIMAIVRSEAELLRAAGPEADRAPVAAAAPRRRFGWLSRPAFALAATVLVLAVGALGGVALFGGADTRTVVAQVAPQGAKVEMIVREGSDHSTLTASGLPTAGEGRVYQVWLSRGKDAPQPTDALFTPNASGTASVDVPGSLEDVDDVLVTSEPDGGSQAPTRNPIIAVKTA